MYDTFRYIYISLYTFVLISIVESKNSYFLISNLEIKAIKYKSSDILHCTSLEDKFCIVEITIKFNSRAIQFYNMTYSNATQLLVDGFLEISFDTNIRLNDSVPILKSKLPQSIDLYKKESTFEFHSDDMVMTLGMNVSCQHGYGGTNCSNIDLCATLPSNICRNNGVCQAENKNIKCRCPSGYKAPFCEELENPCENHQCHSNSICIPSYNARLQYRCECNNQSKGLLCEQAIDPCENNLCINNSKCNYDSKEILQYICMCNQGFTGRLCSHIIEKCSVGKTLCSTNDSSVVRSEVPVKKGLTNVWPFSAMVSFIVICIESILIVILIITIIVKIRRGQSVEKQNDDYLKAAKTKKDSLEFGVSTELTYKDKFANRQSMKLLFDGHDLQAIGNNQVLLSTSGSSTFGKR